MMTIGVDSHKRTHTLVAIDDVGKKLAERTLAATSEGHLDALAWAQRWPERRWAIEDCRHLTRRLESDLLAAGEAVLRVPPRLMAAERRGGREQGKSDPIDALAVARVALREPDLPVACLDGPARELKLLIDHREDLVRERVRMQARLRWHLHELFPGYVIPSRALRRERVFAELDGRLAGVGGTVARIARELVRDIRELTHRANELEREITRIVRGLAPSPARPGGLRRVVGGQDRRGGGRRRAVQVESRVRALERHRPGPGMERRHQVPSQPRRKPADQRRPAPHRPDPVPGHRPGPRLPRHTPRRRWQPDRSDAHAPAPALRRGVPPPAHRRERRNGDRRQLPSGRRLT
jgi:transposase